MRTPLKPLPVVDSTLVPSGSVMAVWPYSPPPWSYQPTRSVPSPPTPSTKPRWRSQSASTGVDMREENGESPTKALTSAETRPEQSMPEGLKLSPEAML